MDREHIENGVVLFLTQGRDALMKALNPIIKQRNDLLKTEDVSMHPEIQKQFQEAIKQEISNEISTNLNLDPEQTYSIIESMDVKAFLGEK